MTLTLDLPYPPSNNRYYRHARGRTYLSEQGAAYRMEVLAKRPRDGWPFTGGIVVVIESFPKVGKGQDLDNMPKAILDSLQSAKIIGNDSQVDELRVIRRPKVAKGKEPFVRVTVEDL